MILQNGLFDPILRTEVMGIDKFETYTNIHKEQQGPTASYLVKNIRERFYQSHMDYVEQRKLDEIWGVVGKKVTGNAGLAEFILDFDGAASDFFFPWLVNVWTSPSLALEMSYGYGIDVRGKWRKAVGDPIDYFVNNDPTFVYNRERQLFVANLATEAKLAIPPRGTGKIVDLGAGRLAWVRWHGFIPEPLKLEILAFDKDPTIDIKETFMQSHFVNNPERLGIIYGHGDLMTELHNPSCAGANLVILGGVASYFPLEMFKSQIVATMHKMLKPDGVFFFDLQLDCPYYRRSVAVFDWPEMKLAESATVAIDTVEKMRRELWKEGMRFGAEYALDTYNEYPTSVMVVLTKK